MNSQLLRADELGIKLEIVRGLPIWEASPVILHQEAIDRIRASIKALKIDNNVCNCYNISDIYVQFADGSLKRPDISIFCARPTQIEEAVTVVPEAVIEVISQGYEKKDLEIGVPFYLSQNVKDVVVFNPYTDEVIHFRGNEVINLTSPVVIELQCGCRCEV